MFTHCVHVLFPGFSSLPGIQKRLQEVNEDPVTRKASIAFAFPLCFYVIWLDAHLICNNNRDVL